MRIFHLRDRFSARRCLPSGAIGLMGIAALSLLLPSQPLQAAEPIVFNRDIRPILSDNCFACHGPDQDQRQVDLRLDVREEAIDRAAITPGKPDESELVSRILNADPEMRMPPVESNKQLTDEQKRLLVRWMPS